MMRRSLIVVASALVPLLLLSLLFGLLPATASGGPDTTENSPASSPPENSQEVFDISFPGGESFAGEPGAGEPGPDTPVLDGLAKFPPAVSWEERAGENTNPPPWIVDRYFGQSNDGQSPPLPIKHVDTRPPVDIVLSTPSQRSQPAWEQPYPYGEPDNIRYRAPEASSGSTPERDLAGRPAAAEIRFQMPAPATNPLTSATASLSSELAGELLPSSHESVKPNTFPDRPAALGGPDAGSMTPLGLASAYTTSLSIVHRGGGDAFSSNFVFTNTGVISADYALDFYWLNGQHYTAHGPFNLNPDQAMEYDMAGAPFDVNSFAGEVVVGGDEPVAAAITTPDYGFISGVVYESDGITQLLIPWVGVTRQSDDWWFGDAYNLSDGSYALGGLPDGDYLVHAHARYPYGSQWYDGHVYQHEADTVTVSGAGQVTATFIMEPGGQITGTVRNAAGTAPLANINVDTNPGGYGTCTDDIGQYILEGLPFGVDYAVVAGQGWNWCEDQETSYVYEYYSETSDYDSATLLSPSEGSDTFTDIDFTLDPAGTISGTVFNAGGTVPLADINVDVEGGGYGTCTDELGRYTIPGLPYGDHIVRAGGDWNWCLDQNSSYSTEYYLNVDDVGSATPVNISESNENVDGINFTLSMAGIITGQVTSYDGPALEGVRVNVYEYDSGDHWGEFWTNTGGFYETHGLPTGDYIVAVDDNNSIPAGYSFQYYFDTSDWNQATPVPVAPETTAAGIDFQLPPGGTISGVVRDSGGAPIPNLKVNVSDLDHGYGWDVCTDVDGAYTVHALPYATFAAQAGGGWNNCLDQPEIYGSQYYDHVVDWDLATPITLDAGNDAIIGIDFDLELGGTISGRVLDADTGLPVSNINLHMEMVDVNYGEGNCTDEDGYFTYYALPYGDYVAQAAGGWNWCQDQPGFYSQQYYTNTYNHDDATILTLSSGDDALSNIDFNLEQGGTISGTVYDSSGSPTLANINVDVEHGGYGTCTDDFGNYSMSGLPPGDYKVHAGGDWNYCQDQNSLYIREYWEETPDAGSADILVVASGSYEHTGIDFTLSQGGQISGRVTAAADGSPLEGVRVEAKDYDSGEGRGDGFSDVDGHYTISGLQTGDYRVRVNDENHIPPGYAYQLYPDTLFHDDAARVPVVLELNTGGIDFHLEPGGSISGQVRDENGPLANINVHSSIRVSEDDRQGGRGACSDENGFYTVNALPYATLDIEAGGSWNWCLDEPGQYARQTYDHVYDWQQATLIVIEEGSTDHAFIDFDLEPGGAISGQVIDADSDLPLANIHIGANLIGENFGEGACTDENGIYEFNAMPAGDYRIDAGQDWNWCTEGASPYIREYYDNVYNEENATPVPLASGSTVTGINFAMDSGGSISGQVTDEGTGLPLENVRVDLDAYDEGGSYHRSSQTGSSGVYTITGLIDLDYRVRVKDPENMPDDYAQQYWPYTFAHHMAEPVSILDGGDVGGIDFALVPGGAIKGFVLDLSDQPLVNLQVNTDLWDGGGGRGSCTDENGYFEISMLIYDQFVIHAGGDYDHCRNEQSSYVRTYYDAVYFRNAATPIEVSSPGPVGPYTIKPTTGGYISGAVTEVGGSPLENIRIEAQVNRWGDCPWCWDNLGSTQTEADGSYLLGPLPPGDVALYACVECDRPDLLLVSEYYINAYSPEMATPVPVEDGQTTSDINFELGQGVLITGSVTVPGSYLAEGIRIDAWINEGWWFGTSTETDVDGNYIVAVPPSYDSRWGVSARPEGTDLGFQRAENFYLGDQTQWDFDLRPGGSISGTITDGGSPVPNAQVHADSRWMNEGADTDEDGYYVISNLPRGSYQMNANQWSERQDSFYHGYDWSTNKPVTLEEGGAISDIDFELPETGLIEGIVTDMVDGTTIEGARIMAMNDSARWEAWSEPDGRFYMDAPAGEYKLVVHPTDWNNNVFGYYLDGGWSYTYRDATPVVVPPLSTGPVTVTINIPQRATLSGKVNDAGCAGEDCGVDGIHVTTLTDDPAVGIEDASYTCTDENGDYTIEHIIPGHTQVIAVGTCGAAEYSNVVTATFTAESGVDHTLDLVMTAGPIPERAFTIKSEQSFDLTPLSSGGSIGVVEADQILPALFAPLVQLDDQGQWYSELLTQVPTTANGGAVIIDGRLEVTYELLPDLVWSDNEPLTSGDIRFAWEKMVQPRIFQDDYWSYYGAAWKVERVETPDLATAVLVYKHSQIPSDYLGAIPYPMPEHILGGEHATDIQHFSEYAHNPVGNGPYVVVDYVPGSHLDLAANPKYHKRELDGGYPRINNVRFLFQNHPFWSVASGQADVSINVGNNLPGDYETYDLDFHSSTASYFGALMPDTRLPFFADKDVRQALYHAMDRESWADQYSYFVEAHSYLPPDHPLYSDTITTYDFNLVTAGNMLTAAGWEDSNSNGIRDKDGVEFSFDLVYNEGSESRRSLLTRYQEDLASIGVDSNVISVPWEEFLENARYGRYDAFALGWGFDSRTDPNAYGLFASRSIPTGYNRYDGSNYTGYWSNTANDALLEAMINELDGGVLADLYAQQTALLSQELPNLPYGWNPQFDVTTPILENFQPNRMTPATWNMEQWYMPDNPYDMSVRKTLAPDSLAPQPGETIIYQVDVQNSGYYTMENVILMDTLPDEVIYAGATPAPSSIVDDKLYWDLGDIAGYQPHGSIFVSVTIPMTVTHDSVISNRVQVWADQVDTNPDNDAFVYQVTVREDVDLAVNKSGVGQPAIGAVYDYTIDYYNLGGAPAADVTLTDTLPAEVTFVAANPPPDLTYGQTLTWTLPSLEGNQWGGQIEITTTIDSAGSLTNTAVIDYDGPETDFDNNIDIHPEEVNEILAPIIIQPTQGVADGTPLVAGQAPAGATVDIYAIDAPGGPSWLGFAVADTNGEFSLELDLEEGFYVIQAEATKGGLTSGHSNASTFNVIHDLPLDPDLVSLTTAGEVIISKGVVRAQLRTLQARVLNVQAPVKCASEFTAELRVTENGLFTYYIPPVTLINQGDNVWLFDTNLWMSEIHSTYDIWLKWDCGGTPGEESLGFILIDPDGYLYDQAMVDAGSTITDSLILNGVITAYVWLEDTWQIWPAAVYDGQFNPQSSDPNVEDGVREPGYYSFLTPPGQFRIDARAPGYQPYKSPILTVINTPIRHDIGLQPIQGGEGVTLSPANLSESYKQVEPWLAWLGDILTYDIWLVNSGEEDTGMLTLTDTIPAGTIYVDGSVNTGESGATFDEAIHWLGDVPAGEDVHISFQVEVIYTPGEPFNVNNLAEVSGLLENVNSLSDLRAVSNIQNQAGVALGEAGSQNGDPGQSVVHNLSVENTGNFTDTYSFSYSSNVEWPVIMPAPITLGAGESAWVPVTVTVFAEAAAGATNVMTITARSQEYTSFSDDVTRITTANQVAGVTFDADGTKSDYPGTSVTFNHTLKNSGNGEDTFSFTYTSSEGWTAAVPGPVTLAAGASQAVEVLVSVPSGVVPGTVDKTIVTVTSAFDGGVTGQVTDQTTVDSPPPDNNPPAFDSDPISKANATAGVAYNGTIENDATDPDGDTLTFSKVGGPTWLTIASNGALSGTPSSSDLGANAWTVKVDDGNGGTDDATLQIAVNGPPTFDSDPITKANATVGVAYNGTIENDATDPDGDPLTFSKVDGPAWLTIAPNGALSGTPSSSDVGANAWTVEVDDGNGGTDKAVLQITVTQHLLYLPILRTP